MEFLLCLFLLGAWASDETAVGRFRGHNCGPNYQETTVALALWSDSQVIVRIAAGVRTARLCQYYCSQRCWCEGFSWNLSGNESPGNTKTCKLLSSWSRAFRKQPRHWLSCVKKPHRQCNKWQPAPRRCPGLRRVRQRRPSWTHCKKVCSSISSCDVWQFHGGGCVIGRPRGACRGPRVSRGAFKMRNRRRSRADEQIAIGQIEEDQKGEVSKQEVSEDGTDIICEEGGVEQKICDKDAGDEEADSCTMCMRGWTKRGGDFACCTKDEAMTANKCSCGKPLPRKVKEVRICEDDGMDADLCEAEVDDGDAKSCAKCMRGWSFREGKYACCSEDEATNTLCSCGKPPSEEEMKEDDDEDEGETEGEEKPKEEETEQKESEQQPQAEAKDDGGKKTLEESVAAFAPETANYSPYVLPGAGAALVSIMFYAVYRRRKQQEKSLYLLLEKDQEQL